MPYLSPLEAVAKANEAIEWARAVRAAHAHKTKKDSKQRQIDVELAKRKLRQAMKPIHRMIAKFPYMPHTPHSEALRQASRDIQRERRKLWKLVNR